MTKLVSTNPANNYEKIGSVTISTDKEIHRKIQEANEAKKSWKDLGVKKRIKLLKPIKDEFLSRSEEIAKLISLEVGKPISESIAEVTRYINEELNWFLDNGTIALADEITFKNAKSMHRIVYEPHGVAAVITPWNFPFGISIWGIFPNLIAGNTVVYKASEECPLIGRLLEEIISNHNLPKGVFAEVYGDGSVGEKLTKGAIDLIWFTGSTSTGKSLYKTAADKFIRVILEMGGSNPCIVFDDIDVKQATPIIFYGRFRNNGQVCTSIKRLIVHEGIADKLTTSLTELLESKKIGHSLESNTDFGSLVSDKQLLLLKQQFQDAITKGAIIAAQAKVPQELKGSFFPATLLTSVTNDMRVWREEVFGPILPIITFKTEEEAITLANDTNFGLGARVMSQDKIRAERIAKQIDAGTVAVNYETHLTAYDPFGGYKASGLGRERGIHGLRELCQIKVIQNENVK